MTKDKDKDKEKETPTPTPTATATPQVSQYNQYGDSETSKKPGFLGKIFGTKPGMVPKAKKALKKRKEELDKTLDY